LPLLLHDVDKDDADNRGGSSSAERKLVVIFAVTALPAAMPITFAALPPAMAVAVSVASDFGFAVSVAWGFDNDLRQGDWVHDDWRRSCLARCGDGRTSKQCRSRGAHEGKASHRTSSS
jgi:hypothetical protein